MSIGILGVKQSILSFLLSSVKGFLPEPSRFPPLGIINFLWLIKGILAVREYHIR